MSTIIESKIVSSAFNFGWTNSFQCVNTTNMYAAAVLDMSSKSSHLIGWL